MTDEAPAETYLTPKQVSEQTGYAVGTLANWRSKGVNEGLVWVKRGARIRYKQSEVTRFMTDKKQTA